MKSLTLIVIGMTAVGVTYYFYTSQWSVGSAVNSVPITLNNPAATVNTTESTNVAAITPSPTTRTISQADSIALPLSGSAPTEAVKHSIPIEEIRRGCFRQDCIPSIDEPVFLSTAEAKNVLPDTSIGIALNYKGETRFYPFPVLETHELVNDVVAGDPVLVSYCPLCGTGIVFDRRVAGEVQEFGVSGMLWQSNLLMYNRADSVAERNLWSQVLGEAVVGNNTGERLAVIPSDIMRFSAWQELYPDGHVLLLSADPGDLRDPYDGQYYQVASQFKPNFNEVESPLPPSTYVYGIEVDGIFKAYPEADVPVGVTTDVINNHTIMITRTESGSVSFSDESGEAIADIEGFWFSWAAAHPETLFWQ